MATIMLKKIDKDFSRYGIIITDQNSGMIKQFVEKPNVFIGDQINAGAYILSHKVLGIMRNKESSIEREVFPILAKTG